MTRDRRLAAILAGAVGVLALLAVAQRFGLGSGYTLADASTGASRGAVPGQVQTEPFKLRPWPEYGELVARPLFSDTRAPEPPDPTVTVDESVAQPLNVTLTGVILSGSLRLAMLKDNQSGESQRVRVGQPLEGAQAGWTLLELKPRGAILDGAGLGTQELELLVDTAGAPPVQPVAAQAAAPAAGAPPVPGQPAASPPAAANAEDIRRRIEERRKQLREEAQRMTEQQNNQ